MIGDLHVNQSFAKIKFVYKTFIAMSMKLTIIY